MTTPITQMPKPEAGQYKNKRKLFLVPNFILPSDIPEDGKVLLQQYWAQIDEHIRNLEKSLGNVKHIYHERIYVEGNEGIQTLKEINPNAAPMIEDMCQRGAKLEATESMDLTQEIIDWSYFFNSFTQLKFLCENSKPLQQEFLKPLSEVLSNQKIMTTAIESSQNTNSARFDHILSTIENTLKSEEPGILVIGEDHRIQFPSEIQIFYLAPPSLDKLNRWISDANKPIPNKTKNNDDTETDSDNKPEENSE